MADDSEAEL